MSAPGQETTLLDLGEDRLVCRLIELIPSDPMVLVGPGDDCAVVTDEADARLLLKTEARINVAVNTVIARIELAADKPLGVR